MKVLVIGGPRKIFKEVERAIAAAEGPDGRRYEVVGLADRDAALRRLEREHFDVVIVDMGLQPDETEGLTVLRTLTNKSPITVVLTAYPSIQNCVASMRAGAWDYLARWPSDGSDPYDNVLKSIRQACEFRLAHPEAGRSNPDSAWVREHLGELMSEYGGQLVAILDGRVIDHDESYGDLTERLKRQYPVARPTVVSIPDPRVEAIE